MSEDIEVLVEAVRHPLAAGNRPAYEQDPHAGDFVRLAQVEQIGGETGGRRQGGAPKGMGQQIGAVR